MKSNKYDTENKTYTFQAEEGLHSDIKKVFNVLDELDENDGDTAHDILGYNVVVDPLHLCRMINRGLLDRSEYMPGEIVHLVNLEYMTPIYRAEEHIGELGIHLASNDVKAYHYDQIGEVDEESEYSEERVENLTCHGTLLEKNLLGAVKHVQEDEDDPRGGKEAVVDMLDQFIEDTLFDIEDKKD